MSAAVAARQQSGGNTHSGNSSNPASRMGTNSPADNKRAIVKNEALDVEDISVRSTPPHVHRELSSKISPPKSASHQQSPLSNTPTSSSIHPPQVTIDQPPDSSLANHSDGNQQKNAQPGSHPQQPPSGQSQSDTPGDYFTLNHNPLDREPNPFEQSFASNSNDALITPKAILPPVTAITSPASLLPGGSAGGFNWGLNSLRSGPLSPAMLQGPAASSNNGSLGGFDSHIRTGLTPNESGIRSGLTPGGSASLFSSSPAQAALFQFVGPNGSSTPSTMEFQRTANAIAASRKTQPPPMPSLTSQPHRPLKQEVDNNPTIANETDHQKPRRSSDYAADPAHHAANGLFLLAQGQHHGEIANNTSMSGTTSGYPAPTHVQPAITGNTSVGPVESPSPSLAKRVAVNNAVTAASMSASINRGASGSSAGSGVRGISEMSDDFSDSGAEAEAQASNNPGSRGGSVRSRAFNKGKVPTSSNGRRKAEDQNPNGGSRTPSSKKAKGNQGQAMSVGSGSGSEDGGDDGKDDDAQSGKDSKKLTDEEKRKNFLERNRVAALKCRQRKKQWLANLQAKVELYTSENDALTAQVTALREEIVSLKTLLLAHKDCPVARTNTGATINGMDIASAMQGEYGHVPIQMGNYTGIQMGGVMGPPGPTRRYS
ncbi:Transcription factor [Rhizina undulata]